MKKRDQQKCLGANTQRPPRREVCTHAQRRGGDGLTYGLDYILWSKKRPVLGVAGGTECLR